jgi:hypothetical protein
MKVNNALKLFGIIGIVSTFYSYGIMDDYSEGVFDKQIGLMNDLRENVTRLFNVSEPIWREYDLTSMHTKGEAVIDNSVKLPKIEIKAEKDKKVKFIVKDLKIKKEDIKINFFPNKQVSVKFPFMEASVSIVIYPEGYAMEGKKKITQEKKDAKGNILEQTSYTGCNQVYNSLAPSINLDSIQENNAVNMIGGDLVIEFKSLKQKEPIISININKVEEDQPKAEVKTTEPTKAAEVKNK